MDRRLIPGIMLIIIGVILLVVTQWDIGGEVVLPLIGATFLVGYARTASYGLLIPGCIMVGLGTGIIVENFGLLASGASVLLGLGAGFLAIVIIGRMVDPEIQGSWWPVIPGLILGGMGILLAIDALHILEMISRWWPAILIAMGLWLLVASRRH